MERDPRMVGLHVDTPMTTSPNLSPVANWPGQWPSRVRFGHVKLRI